ncbi:MAG: hypothetical protein Q4F00_12300 [bacterium]|nr:hypothetical protein [bacterium]
MAYPAMLSTIGYLGSAIAITSFFLASSVKQRFVNALGCLMLVFYCYSVHAYPTTICNACTFLFDLYFLSKLLNDHRHDYYVVPCTIKDGVYQAFIGQHAADIAKYYPSFKADDPQQNFARFIFCGDEAAALQVGIQQGDTIHLTADYSIPKYRDCSVGRYAYSHLGDSGLKLIDVQAADAQTADYFRHVGFQPQEGKLALRLHYAHK